MKLCAFIRNCAPMTVFTKRRTAGASAIYSHCCRRAAHHPRPVSAYQTASSGAPAASALLGDGRLHAHSDTVRILCVYLDVIGCTCAADAQRSDLTCSTCMGTLGWFLLCISQMRMRLEESSGSAGAEPHMSGRCNACHVATVAQQRQAERTAHPCMGMGSKRVC